MRKYFEKRTFQCLLIALVGRARGQGILGGCEGVIWEGVVIWEG